jgi:hypothetical protein
LGADALTYAQQRKTRNQPIQILVQKSNGFNKLTLLIFCSFDQYRTDASSDGNAALFFSLPVNSLEAMEAHVRKIEWCRLEFDHLWDAVEGDTREDDDRGGGNKEFI